MSAEKKREMIELVRRSPQPKRTTIAKLGLAHLTFYRQQISGALALSAGVHVISGRSAPVLEGDPLRNNDPRGDQGVLDVA